MFDAGNDSSGRRFARRLWALPLLLAATAAAAGLFLMHAPQANATGTCNHSALTPPTAPALTGTPAPSGDSVTLTWNAGVRSDTSGPITDHIVYIYKEGVIQVQANFISENRRAYTEAVTGLSPTTAYTAKVVARTRLGCYSALSAEQSFTTTAGGL